MDFHEFVGEVQNRLELPGTGEAVRATRAVLTTLGERLPAGEASNLAGPLPMEVDRFLLAADSGQRFGSEEFVSRVVERAGLPDDEDGRSEAVYYVQAVFALLDSVVPGEEFDEVRESLPEDGTFDAFFELVGVDEAFEGASARGS